MNDLSVKGVQNFVLDLSDMTGVEIGGYEVSNKGDNNTNYVLISNYKNSTYSSCSNSMADFYRQRYDLLGKIEIRFDFHTHPSLGTAGRAGSYSLDASRGKASDQDIKRKNAELKKNPNMQFYILTRGYSPIDYTNK